MVIKAQFNMKATVEDSSSKGKTTLDGQMVNWRERERDDN